MALVFNYVLSQGVFAMATTRQQVEKAFSRIAGMLKRLAKYVEEIGKEGEAIRTIKKEYDKQITQLRKEGQSKVSPHEKRREKLFNDLLRLALPNWKGLVNKGKETIELSTGTIQSRLAALPKVTVLDEEKAVKALLRKGFRDCVRVIKEVDKEMIQKKPDVAKGIRWISMERSRTLTVKPIKGVVLARSLEKMSEKI
ncbi:MAG: host-nuclease inhibitor Gam family protein [Patescibacteria group bacterium]|nr:host-nuclease inhibitor Gam family protein [Patescibacteria group bacterium]